MGKIEQVYRRKVVVKRSDQLMRWFLLECNRAADAEIPRNRFRMWTVPVKLEGSRYVECDERDATHERWVAEWSDGHATKEPKESK